MQYTLYIFKKKKHLILASPDQIMLPSCKKKMCVS